jgi:hypothetical protein
MLQFLDSLFHVIHISIIIINMTFWFSFRTLKIAQVTLLLNMISWIGFGFWHGIGYCFLTDWNWRIKEKMGETNLPASYIKLVVDRTFKVNSDPLLVDWVTFVVLGVSLLGCLFQTIRKAARN